jgi:phosphoribosylaminoimidazole-succinocarboxamide synthase
MGSVKDLEIVKKSKKTKMGIGRFYFSDRYSVFDWGKMPDLIDEKGAALCVMGAYTFEKLEDNGVKTHYRGLVLSNEKIVTTDELEKPVNVMEFNLVNVFQPKSYEKAGKLAYDYSVFTPHMTNFLVPLEVIYRNGLPEGSSIFKRLEKGTTKLEDLGLDRYPKPGEKLEKPIFDVSTKLETHDRYLTWYEAQKISSLTDEEVAETKKILLNVDSLITKVAAKASLVNEDGKIELAMDNHRRLMVADVVGTLDECRFTYEKIHVSKEIARQFYKTTKWYRNLEESKNKSASEGIKEWKNLCKTEPPKLDTQLKSIVSNMYLAAANEYTRLGLFDSPRLVDVIKEYNDYMLAK